MYQCTIYTNLIMFLLFLSPLLFPSSSWKSLNDSIPFGQREKYLIFCKRTYKAFNDLVSAAPCCLICCSITHLLFLLLLSVLHFCWPWITCVSFFLVSLLFIFACVQSENTFSPLYLSDGQLLLRFQKVNSSQQFHWNPQRSELSLLQILKDRCLFMH